MKCLFVVLLLVVSSLSLQGADSQLYTYVGRITADSFLLAWGTVGGEGNTIGRNSVSLGSASVVVNGNEVQATHGNWVEVKGLDPDRDYGYRLLLSGREVSAGHVRTFPRLADHLCFFVIGDFGTGKTPQYEIAEAMTREFEKRRNSDDPVRFVLTTGDNIYSSGRDHDWKSKFFEPYKTLIREVPFYPSIGNHDLSGGPRESDEKLLTYLDNFFLPVNDASPYYAFSFGGLVTFFALDSTDPLLKPANSKPQRPGDQVRWLEDSLRVAREPWKFAYFHHPPFTAGPKHKPSLLGLAPVVDLFRQNSVQVVFSGHEHNFQVSAHTDATGDTLYVVSGAGGELRSGEIYRNMARSGIAGTAPQNHFLVVEVDREKTAITPLSWEPVLARDVQRRPVPLPIVVRRTLPR